MSHIDRYANALRETAVRGVREIYRLELVNGTFEECTLEHIRENLREQLEHLQLHYGLRASPKDIKFGEMQIEATGSAVDVYTKMGDLKDFVVVILRYHWGTDSFTYHLDSSGTYKSVSHLTQAFRNPSTVTSAMHHILVRKVGMDKARSVTKSIQRDIDALGIKAKPVKHAGFSHPALLN